MAGSPNSGVIPNVNDPEVQIPTNDELRFNPKGAGAIGTAIQDPIGALLAYSADQATREATRRMYPNAVGSYEADAFRHGAGSRLLKGLLGEARAKNWGDAHEVDGIDPARLPQALGIIHKNTEGQRAMDLYNNKIGRTLPDGRAEQIKEAIKQGRLRLSPFQE